MTQYFGFALADSMFKDATEISRKNLTVDEVKVKLESGYVSCCNPSHVATIKAAAQRFDLVVDIPATPPRVDVSVGDSVIVMGVRGLPRLTDRHEYTDEEVASATFEFSCYSVTA